ncbi:MAG TPA: hypothetical protein VGP88_08565, partial [Thermoplasmata archaeon]|nr:hypothetical protein [Thermoplasmata archaeon]
MERPGVPLEVVEQRLQSLSPLLRIVRHGHGELLRHVLDREDRRHRDGFRAGDDEVEYVERPQAAGDAARADERERLPLPRSVDPVEDVLLGPGVAEVV